MLKMVLATARDRARLKEITSVLIRYGLQDVLRLLGLGHCCAVSAASPPCRTHRPCLNGCGRRSRRWAPPSSNSVRSWPRVLTSWIRPGPTNWIACTAKRRYCHGRHWRRRSLPIWGRARAPVCRVRSHAAGGSVDGANLPRPLAQWRTGGGESAAARPGETIHADLRLLASLAETVEQQSPTLARYRPRQMVRALATALNHELDLTHEGHNCDRVAKMFAREPDVVVPKIYWQWSSPRLLVQEYLPGTAPENPQQLAAAGFDGPLLASTRRPRLYEAWCWSIGCITPIPTPATSWR